MSEQEWITDRLPELRGVLGADHSFISDEVLVYHRTSGVCVMTMYAGSNRKPYWRESPWTRAWMNHDILGWLPLSALPPKPPDGVSLEQAELVIAERSQDW